MSSHEDLPAFIQRLPKTETHLHIEAALSLERFRQLEPEKLPGTPPWYAPDFRYPSFADFSRTFRSYLSPCFRSTQDYYEVSKTYFDGLCKQNVVYLETSFQLGIATTLNVPGAEIARAILSAVPAGLTVVVYGAMCRNDYHGPMQETIDEAASAPEMVGLDLHGPEDLPLEPWTAEVWARARSYGKRNKVHVGEFGGPDRMWEAIRELKITKIQHGVRAIEDDRLVDYLAQHQITLDMCPLSNEKLLAVKSLDSHPLPEFLRRGVSVTISSDNPFLFGNTVTDDYLAAGTVLGLSRDELIQTIRYALKGSSISDSQRDVLLKNLQAAATEEIKNL